MSGASSGSGAQQEIYEQISTLKQQTKCMKFFQCKEKKKDGSERE